MSSTQTSAIPPNTIQEQEEKGLSMATPFLVGIGAIGAALAGRHLLRAGASRGAKEFVKGGFKTKMDRKEAIEILGLKYVHILYLPILVFFYTSPIICTLYVL